MILAGLICMLIGFLWMAAAETTMGLYLVLAAAGGALIFEGLYMVKTGKRK